MGSTLYTTDKPRLRPMQRSNNHPFGFVQRSAAAGQQILEPHATGCACGGSCPRCLARSAGLGATPELHHGLLEQGTTRPVADTGHAPVTLRGQISSAEEEDEAAGTTDTDIAPEVDEGMITDEGVETPTPETPLGGGPDCPVTAVFSSMLAGMEKASCQVPEGQFGVSRLARFRLHGLTPGSGPVTIQEQFTKIDDPCELFPALKVNSFTTSQAIFDDCYMLASKKPLPDDCTLTVEQNHLLNGKVISKNRITFGPKSLRFCTFPRLPGSCDFSSRCKK